VAQAPACTAPPGCTAQANIAPRFFDLRREDLREFCDPSLRPLFATLCLTFRKNSRNRSPNAYKSEAENEE
jgi:hypothetical protein